jgi:anti-anti-sigma factor
MNGLEINRRTVGGAEVLRLLRPLTNENYVNLPGWLASLFAGAGAAAAIIDLRGVDFADSTGISILLSSKKTADAAGKRFALCNMSPYFKDVFDKLSLSAVFDIFDSIEDAVAGSK